MINSHKCAIQSLFLFIATQYSTNNFSTLNINYATHVNSSEYKLLHSLAVKMCILTLISLPYLQLQMPQLSNTATWDKYKMTTFNSYRNKLNKSKTILVSGTSYYQYSYAVATL